MHGVGNLTRATYATAYSSFTRKTANLFIQETKYDCARVWNDIHAAHFPFMFLVGFLAVPLVRQDFESAPLIFCLWRCVLV